MITEVVHLLEPPEDDFINKSLRIIIEPLYHGDYYLFISYKYNFCLKQIF